MNTSVVKKRKDQIITKHLRIIYSICLRIKCKKSNLRLIFKTRFRLR